VTSKKVYFCEAERLVIIVPAMCGLSARKHLFFARTKLGNASQEYCAAPSDRGAEAAPLRRPKRRRHKDGHPVGHWLPATADWRLPFMLCCAQLRSSRTIGARRTAPRELRGHR